MIKAKGQRPNGTPFVILGLSRENCRRLLEGHPIPVDFNQFGLACEVLICAGETEQTILRALSDDVDLPPQADWKLDDEQHTHEHDQGARA